MSRAGNLRRVAFLAPAAICAGTTFASPAPVQAQALQPVVDVCTGVGIDDSALRTLLQRTLVPTAQGVENLFDDLLTVNILGTPLLSLPDVNLGVAATASDIAAGNTVSLQVLDTDGNIVGSGTCNITTDGYALSTPAGIALGGNQLIGLGSGAPASAAELDAIAIGNGASTSAGASGAVAIGSGASVTAANGVAIGAGSVNNRPAAAGYSAYGLTAPVSSAGSVSFGAPGMERQLTNVAPGTAATDAATLGQVQGAVAAATADTVGYSDSSHTSIALDGAGGTRITNLAPGTVAAGSSDAVNGAQLYAINQQVAANTGTIATLQADLSALSFNAVQYDSPTFGSVTFAGAAGTTLDNVAAGTLAAGSQQAVNGSQLYATNQQVAANTAAIGGLDARVTQNTADIAAVDARVTQNSADIAATGAQVAQNTADIATLGTQVAQNSADISGLGTQVNQNTADISSLSTQVGQHAGDIAALDGRVTNNTTAISQIATSVSAIDARVTSNTTQIAAVQAQVNNVPVRYVSDSDTSTPVQGPSDTVAFTGASGGPVRVANVADGSAATDAVNMRQLQASVSQLQGGLSQTLADANAYTDMRLAEIGFDLSDMRENAFAGTAAAMAVATIPQVSEAGKSMIGGAVGHYRGQTAFGFGVSAAGEEVTFKASGTIDMRGKGGIAVGAGVSF